jgi:hypothetical protein
MIRQLGQVYLSFCRRNSTKGDAAKVNEVDKENYKKKILNDLDLSVPITYRRYGIILEEFLIILSELENEQMITYNIIRDILPNGNPSPFYGDPKNIRLRK